MKKTLLSLAVPALALVCALATPATAASNEYTGLSRPCPGPNQYYGDPNDPTKSWECSNGVAYQFECPAGLWWDTKLLTCNYPEQVLVDQKSSTTAGPAHLRLLPLGLTGLHAHVDTGPGIGPWADVTFTAADGTVLCAAQADGSGNASCDASPGVLGLVADLLTGYTATYRGLGDDHDGSAAVVRSSSGHGTIALL
ncbi:chitin binding peritrophin-A domain-containing protein [Kitasatospora purpeofusca]|uniref:chitin binding peritrophin-A domain-containing protein n=1 Tax=Kitasatospora purpeofusca TaxID=67352 RepID=UPI003816B67A